MDEKIFLYLRLRIGDAVLGKSKIREFAALGRLLADFLRATLQGGLKLPEGVAPGVPVLDYVDANTEQVLIGFQVDPQERTQVVAGCIPPSHQRRMLDPERTSFPISQFTSRAGQDLPPEERAKLEERVTRSRLDLLNRIREALDEEGRFEIRVPLG